MTPNLLILFCVLFVHIQVECATNSVCGPPRSSISQNGYYFVSIPATSQLIKDDISGQETTECDYVFLFVTDFSKLPSVPSIQEKIEHLQIPELISLYVFTPRRHLAKGRMIEPTVMIRIINAIAPQFTLDAMIDSTIGEKGQQFTINSEILTIPGKGYRFKGNTFGAFSVAIYGTVGGIGNGKHGKYLDFNTSIGYFNPMSRELPKEKHEHVDISEKMNKLCNNTQIPDMTLPNSTKYMGWRVVFFPTNTNPPT